MGREKERMIQAEDNWNDKARHQDIYCPKCGALIEYHDREIYFAKGHCGVCQDNEEDDD